MPVCLQGEENAEFYLKWIENAILGKPFKHKILTKVTYVWIFVIRRTVGRFSFFPMDCYDYQTECPVNIVYISYSLICKILSYR